MTAREAKELLGKVGSLAVKGIGKAGTLQVDVRIVDVREQFGRVNYLVEPVSGSGTSWRAAHNVRVQKGGSK